MRRTKAALGIAAAWLLVTATSQAAETKGDTGGKGGNGPAAGPTAGGDPSASAVPTIGPRDNPDTSTHRIEEPKPWEVSASFETHRMIRQEDLEDTGANKVFNVLAFSARYDLSEHDRIAIGDYFQQNYIADEGESGIRSGDVTFRYTRTQPLPRQFVFSATGALSAPTSFYSQKASLITAPTLILQLDKRFGRYVGITARATGGVAIVKYAEQEGGNPNGKWRLGAALEAEVIMPFHTPLSIGADIATNYTWLYNVQSGNGTPDGVVQDTQFPNGQPVMQTYGGEIFVRYALPNLAGIKSDFSLALADGDPSLGYNSVLHDGVSEFYLFFRQTAEVYGTFSVRY